MDAKYTVEEMREMANKQRETMPMTAAMLTAYANLLAEIERAKAGVTDEAYMKASEAIAARFSSDFFDERMVLECGRAALESVAHLLPRGEVGVDESAVPVAWMRRTIRHKRIGGREDGERVMSASKVYPDDEPLFTHPPAQAAQVDADLYKSACDSVEEWKARALKAEEVSDRLMAEINQMTGPTFMGEPVLSKAPTQVTRAEVEAFLVAYHAEVWAAGEGNGTAYDQAGEKLAKAFLARFNTTEPVAHEKDKP